MPVAHGVDLARRARAHGRGRAGGNRIVGVELDVVQARVVRGLDQQRQVRAPVAGDHRVGARLLDLGDIGREVAHLGQRREVVADDLDIGTLGLEHVLGVLRHLVAVGVVLVDQIDLLHIGKVLHVGGQRLHLHRGVSVEAEVPVAALAVRQVRIHRGIVEVDDLLALVARVVLFQRIHDGQRRARAIALHHVARALVHGRAQRAGGFLRAELVVNADHFEFHAGRILLAEFLRQELEALELVRTQRCHQAGQRVQPGDLDGLPLLRKRPARAGQDHRCRHCLESELHCLSPYGE